jgi:DNA-directed RNA polymerase subunit E'/Rpb7
MNRIKKSSQEKTQINLNNINIYQDKNSKKVSELSEVSENEDSLNVNIINTENSSITGGAKKEKIANSKVKNNKVIPKKTDIVEQNEELINTVADATVSALSNITTDTDISKSSFQSSLLHSPYIETSLRCPIMLNPTQMDNKLQLHLKSNLNNYTKGRCYLNYGYIIKINKIEEISDGRIEEEDSSCSAKFIVKFSCRLCLPAKNREIICKIDRMNKALISGVNGPIKAIITPDKINKEKFFTDTDRNIRIKSSSQLLEPEMYIKVLILSSTFSHYDTNIIAISYLQDIATEQEVKMFEREQYLNQI